MKNTKYNKLTTMEKMQLLEELYSEKRYNIHYEDTVIHIPGTGGVVEINTFEQIMNGIKYKKMPYKLTTNDGLIQYVEFDTSFFIDLWEYYVNSMIKDIKNKQNDENFLKDNDIQLNTTPADGINDCTVPANSVKLFSEIDEKESNAFFEKLKDL